MNLNNSYFGVEVAANQYIPRARLDGRSQVCGHCRQAIRGPLRSWRHGRYYHPACSRKLERVATVTTSAPTVIATLIGVALSFDRAGCGIVSADGANTHERFKLTAFNESLRTGHQSLTVNHSFSRRLRGAFSRIFVDAGELKFQFRLLDGPHEHATLQKIRNGQIRYCSVGFRPEERRYVGRVLEHTRATLTEVSLCDGTLPAWYATHVEAAPV